MNRNRHPISPFLPAPRPVLAAAGLLAALLSGGALRANPAWQPLPDPLALPSPVQQAEPARSGVALAVLGLIATPDPAWGPAAGEQEQLHRLYEPGGYAPRWLEPGGRPGGAAHEALALLQHAAAEGLAPADYRAGALAERAARLQNGSAAVEHDAASFDVGLSRALLRYLRHLHQGRIAPGELGLRMPQRTELPDYAALLDEALASRRGPSALAETLAPASAQYRRLREMLAHYRGLAADPGLAPLPAAATVRPGDEYAGVQALQRRLATLGDLPAGLPPQGPLYEGALVEGVRRFQTRHGLLPDGILGPRTWAALNVPLAQRVRQLELALERHRWLPGPGERPYLTVNIPMFQLAAWEPASAGAGPAMRMNVIVGRALETQTPVFAEDMRYIVFRPYWNIPRSIVQKEILPLLEQDPGYLGRRGMELVQSSGGRVRTVEATPENIELLRQGALRLRQRPGPGNALGPVKFIFPNDHAVYLHGTPATSLFERSRRDLSHGCVRVEDPTGLAEWLLRDRPDWTRERIEAAMAGSRPQRVDLPQPVPVLLHYVTAAVMPQDGSLHFASDIYGHDRKLEQALAQRGAL